jgi:hypothetical protein
MHSVAVQYYQQGAVMATEQLKYTDALQLSKKTEKAVKLFYSQVSFDNEENARGAVSYLYRLVFVTNCTSVSIRSNFVLRVCPH